MFVKTKYLILAYKKGIKNIKHQIPDIRWAVEFWQLFKEDLCGLCRILVLLHLCRNLQQKLVKQMHNLNIMNQLFKEDLCGFCRILVLLHLYRNLQQKLVKQMNNLNILNHFQIKISLKNHQSKISSQKGPVQNCRCNIKRFCGGL